MRWRSVPSGSRWLPALRQFLPEQSVHRRAVTAFLTQTHSLIRKVYAASKRNPQLRFDRNKAPFERGLGQNDVPIEIEYDWGGALFGADSTSSL